MVDRECPKDISMPDGSFSYLLKAGVPLSLCYTSRQGLNLEDAVWTAKQSKTGFYFSFYWNHCKTVIETADLF